MSLTIEGVNKNKKQLTGDIKKKVKDEPF